MIGWIALLATIARADEYYLEAAPVPDRAAATRVEQVAEAAGFDARVVRRFRLGKGWEFVVLVESFPGEAQAAAAAVRLESDLGAKVTAWRLDGTEKPISVVLAAPPPDAADVGAASWIERARVAHGGATGGAGAVGRAGAVHFTFSRTLQLAGKQVAVHHDYWREGASRRLVVDTAGAGQDSLSVATASGAWIRVGGQVQSRDIGITIGMVDAFAPEAVLTVALEAARLLDGAEVGAFRPLEGAESGLRFGAGGDESETGLSWVDIDPSTAQLVRVRYVSEAGPITFELSGWRKVAGGVLVPAEVHVERADGGKESLRVDGLELLDRAPASTFDKPA
ncbi:MAG: hypothetical protein Q7U06_01505 [Pseudomonadota bacterium]|nr:hypothetical protein [Pseudomonadota bacterium]